MAKKEYRMETIRQMMDHLDESLAEATDVQCTPAAIPARLTKDTTFVRSILEQVLTVLTKTGDDGRHLLNKLRKNGLDNATYLHAKEYWHKLFLAIHELEQLLWVYCDEYWFSRVDMTNDMLRDPQLLENAIEIEMNADQVLIRMPHIAARKEPRYRLPEDLLAAKLASLRNLPKLGQCHATFCHVYPSSVSSMPKDVDNYYYKRVIDLLAYTFGFSDCPMTFSMSMESFVSDTVAPGTYIWLEKKLPKKFENQILLRVNNLSKTDV